MRSFSALVPFALFAPATGQAEVYFTVEQAQATLFPGETLAPHPVTLTDEQTKAIEKASRVRVREREVKAWKASGGGWMLVDQVLGKHEFIQYAIALDASGAVSKIEILEYRETYGGQVRDPRWRAQFAGKKAGDRLAIDEDIDNVSGATLSCVHVTEGVRRLLATYVAVLAQG